MSLWQLASRSLRHFWQTNLALLLGISICTAVLAGALIVGDSIRASLKSLTIQRLGRIDDLLLSDHFMRAELADELRSSSTTEEHYREVIPAILLNQTTVEVDDMSTTSRMQGVTVIGCDASFWDLDTAGVRPRVIPSANQIVINESVALELGVVVGQRLLIRVGKSDGIGADSPLANKDDLVQTIVDLEIVDVIPTKGLGRFSLRTSQQVPANAFVSLATLQDGLAQENKINAIIVASRDADRPASAQAFASLQAALQPQLGDLGLSLKRVQLTYQADNGQQMTVAQYDQLGSEQMLFAPEADPYVAAAVESSRAQSVFTYLATRLDKLNAAGEPAGDVVPYSTISGVESVSEIGPLMSNGEPIDIADDGIVLNTWAAEDLQAEVGDRIRVTYFEPETTHGETVERSAEFQLQAVVPITRPSRPFARRRAAVYDQPPTLATDPDLTPEVPGITDKGPISQWEAPFPIDYDLLDPRDDEYGDYYRTMPKAFVSLATSRRLWRSRFGETTSYRLPAVADVSSDDVARRLAAELRPHADAFGLRWLRVKTDGLRASAGTTPFDALFLGFSMFIIAAALVLVSLLLRLSLEQRAAQIGLLASLGFDWKRNLRALLLENSLIVVVGSMLGVALGVGYAWLMLLGLRTWWVAAVVTPFMELSVQPLTLALGGLLGVLASLITVVLTLRRLRKISAARLLSGKTDEDQLTSLDLTQRSWLAYAPWALLIAAIGLDLIAPRLAPEPQAGAFFGSGSCVLIAILLLISSRLRRAAVTSPHSLDLTLKSLAARNLTRNPARSTLTIGLVASACFLIVAISAFRLAPTDEGTGGFQLVGQSDQPIFADLRDPAELESRFKNQDPQGLNIFPLRMQDGDDASCRNLYRTARPRLIGITETFRQNAAAVGKVEWAGVDKQLAAEGRAWDVLAGDLPMEPDVIPVVLDKNTAMYSMQLYGGIGEEFERDYGPAGTLKFRVVGLLAGSIFQGSLLIPDAELLRHFPRVSGSRYFLVACPESDSDAVSAVLEEQFSTEGLDLTDTRRLLTELLAVQNTYLSTFQSLGGLGLLLGTFGLAAVQLRNVIQRRGELALLRATGYRNDQLSILLLWEHALLLFGGLAVGVLAAAVVVLPHLLFGGASIPILSLAMTLGLVAIAGLASAVIAQRYLNKTPLLPALRGD